MNAKAVLFRDVLPQLKEASSYFTTEAITRRVKKLGLQLSEGTLRVYLSEATACSMMPIITKVHKTILQCDGLERRLKAKV